MTKGTIINKVKQSIKEVELLNIEKKKYQDKWKINEERKMAITQEVLDLKGEITKIQEEEPILKQKLNDIVTQTLKIEGFLETINSLNSVSLEELIEESIKE